MELNGAEKYFSIIRRDDGRYIVRADKLEGGAFMAKNWKGLERLTINGMNLIRVIGIPRKFCVYEEVRPAQQP